MGGMKGNQQLGKAKQQPNYGGYGHPTPMMHMMNDPQYMDDEEEEEEEGSMVLEEEIDENFKPS